MIKSTKIFKCKREKLVCLQKQLWLSAEKVTSLFLFARFFPVMHESIHAKYPNTVLTIHFWYIFFAHTIFKTHLNELYTLIRTATHSTKEHFQQERTEKKTEDKNEWRIPLKIHDKSN